jgi:hypothetical protein
MEKMKSVQLLKPYMQECLQEIDTATVQQEQARVHRSMAVA